MKYCSCTRDGTVLEVFEQITEVEYDANKNIVWFKWNGIGTMFSGMDQFLILPDSVPVSPGDPVTDDLRNQDIRDQISA
ncbi:hypothetical protein L2649_08465 [Thermoactinomyces vulgaris]|jgi:hypothetical protein|uniref:hypothetical protein n=1 Tax=Thermoactinomyces TaxID=2023 RepID=UPI0018DDE4E4|nr:MULTISPECIES: hypothetical protein [Thermoactinomyces]MBH8582718.1 hypothetical protein [Thermoactinomyces sp. CICC 10735]MBH8601193.1 hypothetical protein [Thermoactinomyces sp. CICC 23799]MCF6135203.1 hypothetical protein [Thermoactinomyces vulgaris]